MSTDQDCESTINIRTYIHSKQRVRTKMRSHFASKRGGRVPYKEKIRALCPDSFIQFSAKYVSRLQLSSCDRTY